MWSLLVIERREQLKFLELVLPDRTGPSRGRSLDYTERRGYSPASLYVGIRNGSLESARYVRFDRSALIRRKSHDRRRPTPTIHNSWNVDLVVTGRRVADPVDETLRRGTRQMRPAFIASACRQRPLETPLMLKHGVRHGLQCPLGSRIKIVVTQGSAARCRQALARATRSRWVFRAVRVSVSVTSRHSTDVRARRINPTP